MDKREDVKSYYPGDCGKDKREDSGNYYPGGTVVPQSKVPGGQENFVQKQEKLEVKTNTIADLREAVKELAKAMGATVVSVFAAMAAFSAEVHTAKLEKVDLDTGVVVTNVTFEGLATAADLDDKRDKTDLTVYGLVTNSYRLAKECLPVRGYIVQQDVWSELDITSWEMADWPDPEGPFEKILTAKRSDGASYFALLIDEGGRPIYEDGLVAFSMTYGGKPFEAGKWPILEPVTGITPTGDTLATTSTVAKIARSVVNTVWDPELGVAWEARMHDGQLYYVAVTNRPPEGK